MYKTLLVTLTASALSTVAVEVCSRRQGRAAGCRDP